jgi:hypothetical protein
MIVVGNKTCLDMHHLTDSLTRHSLPEQERGYQKPQGVFYNTSNLIISFVVSKLFEGTRFSISLART